jgi:FKBP-type peptidyl-prolyl cis-trans isomerase (trigger factor)
MTHFKDIKATFLPNSLAEITGAITLEFIAECRKEALAELNKKTNFPGFRAGFIPEDILVKRLGELPILEEAAEIALGREYVSIIKEAKVNAIGRPSIAITKLAPGTPLEFKITTAVEPEFDLPDYKKLIKAISSEGNTEVTDKEVEDVLEEIKKQDIKPELKEGENIQDKIKENILREKQLKAKEVRRLSIIDTLIKETKVDIPLILVEAELEKMIGQFQDDVVRAGLKWEDYLKSIKKTEADVRIDWKDKAMDRAKAELIVKKIAETEKVEPTVEEVEHEAKHLLEHYPDADPLRARVYVYTYMQNEKVFQFLENIK